MASQPKQEQGSRRVKCPRCEFRMSERLHMIMASDSFNCPRCEGIDGLTIPMFIDEGETGRFEIPDEAAERLLGRS